MKQPMTDQHASLIRAMLLNTPILADSEAMRDGNAFCFPLQIILARRFI